MRIVVAIHDLPVWTIPASEVARVAAALPDDEVIDARDGPSRLREFARAEVLFATRISAEEFGVARALRWIHSSAVGVGGLLPPALVASDLPVTNSRGVHSDAVAEHAIALMLALRRQLHVAGVRQTERVWAQEELSRTIVAPLARTHLLVVGLGSIGSRIAALASSLGMRVTGVRARMTEPVPLGVSEVLPADRLADGLAAADIVMLALPRTQQTRALVGAPELATMKRTAVLVNIARGRLLDESALVDALRSGRIAGAALDAFQQEPLPPDHQLWTLPNVLITPHTAAFSGDYWGPVVDLFLENVERFKRRDPLINVVDKARGY